eukprot:CFRG7801T1
MESTGQSVQPADRPTTGSEASQTHRTRSNSILGRVLSTKVAPVPKIKLIGTGHIDVKNPESISRVLDGLADAVPKRVSTQDTDIVLDSEEESIRYTRIFFGRAAPQQWLIRAPLKILKLEIMKAGNYLESVHILIIVVNHGPYTWVVRRRMKELHVLHDILSEQFRGTSVEMPKLANRLRLQYAGLKHTNEVKGKFALEYLQKLLNAAAIKTMVPLLNFLAVSRYSFVREIGLKYNEGFVNKKGGGHRFRLGPMQCCKLLTSNRRWCIIKDSCVILVSKADDVRTVLLFDTCFQIKFGEETTGQKNGLTLTNKYRHLKLQTDEHFEVTSWVTDLAKVLRESVWVKGNVFQSFAPERPRSWSRWYVDGRDYLVAVYRGIMSAKEEIYIADWWLSPEIFLCPPDPITNAPVLESRLDNILAKKAAEGVKICIIMYKNVELAVGINSLYSKHRLKSLHKSISVMRHPDHPPDGVWLWAHHEKIVCIDQSLAFIGGIDLCFGRSDTKDHDLTDVYIADEHADESSRRGRIKRRLFVKVERCFNLPSHQFPKPKEPPPLSRLSRVRTGAANIRKRFGDERTNISKGEKKSYQDKSSDGNDSATGTISGKREDLKSRLKAKLDGVRYGQFSKEKSQQELNNQNEAHTSVENVGRSHRHSGEVETRGSQEFQYNRGLQTSSCELQQANHPVRRASSVEDVMTGQWRQLKQRIGLIEKVTEDEADRDVLRIGNQPRIINRNEVKRGKAPLEGPDILYAPKGQHLTDSEIAMAAGGMMGGMGDAPLRQRRRSVEGYEGIAKHLLTHKHKNSRTQTNNQQNMWGISHRASSGSNMASSYKSTNAQADLSSHRSTAIDNSGILRRGTTPTPGHESENDVNWRSQMQTPTNTHVRARMQPVARPALEHRRTITLLGSTGAGDERYNFGRGASGIDGQNFMIGGGSSVRDGGRRSRPSSENESVKSGYESVCCPGVSEAGPSSVGQLPKGRVSVVREDQTSEVDASAKTRSMVSNFVAKWKSSRQDRPLSDLNISGSSTRAEEVASETDDHAANRGLIHTPSNEDRDVNLSHSHEQQNSAMYTQASQRGTAYDRLNQRARKTRESVGNVGNTVVENWQRLLRKSHLQSTLYGSDNEGWEDGESGTPGTKKAFSRGNLAKNDNVPREKKATFAIAYNGRRYFGEQVEYQSDDIEFLSTPYSIALEDRPNHKDGIDRQVSTTSTNSAVNINIPGSRKQSPTDVHFLSTSGSGSSSPHSQAQKQATISASHPVPQNNTNDNVTIPLNVDVDVCTGVDELIVGENHSPVNVASRSVPVIESSPRSTSHVPKATQRYKVVQQTEHAVRAIPMNKDIRLADTQVQPPGTETQTQLHAYAPQPPITDSPLDVSKIDGKRAVDECLNSPASSEKLHAHSPIHSNTSSLKQTSQNTHNRTSSHSSAQTPNLSNSIVTIEVNSKCEGALGDVRMYAELDLTTLTSGRAMRIDLPLSMVKPDLNGLGRRQKRSHIHTRPCTHGSAYIQKNTNKGQPNMSGSYDSVGGVRVGFNDKCEGVLVGECAACDGNCVSGNESDSASENESESEGYIYDSFITIEYMYLGHGEAQKFKQYPKWVGKDYSNPCVRDFFDLHKPFDDSVDRWAQTRMPWHDVGMAMYGQCARDVGRHFIDRWNHVKVVKAKNDLSVPFLCPKREIDMDTNINVREHIPKSMGVPSHYTPSVHPSTPPQPHTPTGSHTDTHSVQTTNTDIAIAENGYSEVGRSPRSTSDCSAKMSLTGDAASVVTTTVRRGLHMGVGDEFFRTSNQVLRSCCEWSNGIPTEHSIMNGYLSAISKAQHYIYIENQFFVTSLHADGVTNSVGDALFDKIVECHKENRKFRVYVVMPLMPAFEGDFGPNATSLQVVMHWQYKSISRGPDSLLGRLKAAVGNWKQYITFACLRQHSNLMGEPVENQIYVHSKLLIVDDTTVICGSANINDRSMLGSRDSEIAVLLQDEEFEDSVMDGLPYKSGRYARSLRKRIFSEHLGLTDEEAGGDVVHKDFFDGIWNLRAKANTDIYEHVFRTVPNDHVYNWEDLEAWKSVVTIAESDPDKAFQDLLSVKGHIVELPMEFLREVNLGPSRSTREGWVPMRTFT